MRVVASRPPGGPPPFATRARINLSVARMLLSRGHLREAYAVAPHAGLDVALRRRRADRRGATGQRGVDPAATAPGARLAAAGRGIPLVGWPARPSSLAAAAVRADSAARHGADPAARVVGRYAAGSAAACLELARADTGAALQRLRALDSDGCPGCYLDRFTRRGAARRAWPRCGRVGHSSGGPPERHAQPVSDGCALGAAARACGGAARRPCDGAALLRLGRRDVAAPRP